jgi:hypothetical protein
MGSSVYEQLLWNRTCYTQNSTRIVFKVGNERNIMSRKKRASTKHFGRTFILFPLKPTMHHRKSDTHAKALSHHDALSVDRRRERTIGGSRHDEVFVLQSEISKFLEVHRVRRQAEGRAKAEDQKIPAVERQLVLLAEMAREMAAPRRIAEESLKYLRNTYELVRLVALHVGAVDEEETSQS